MDTQVKQLLVDRLLSGQDEQGRGLLRSEDNKLCCLGVLSEIAVEQGVIEPPILVKGAYLYGEELNEAGLCSEVREWSGIDSMLGRFDNGHYITALSSLNDNCSSFAEIAAVINEHF